jgi:hypothetical protein
MKGLAGTPTVISRQPEHPLRAVLGISLYLLAKN